jgi:hypothetical protein
MKVNSKTLRKSMLIFTPPWQLLHAGFDFGGKFYFWFICRLSFISLGFRLNMQCPSHLLTLDWQYPSRLLTQ